MIATALNIGRRRGEFEKATATMRSVQGGHRHPRDGGVGEMGFLADAYRSAADVFGAQRKEGRLARGVPDALWLAACGADALHPAGYTGRDVPAEKLWIFMPEQKDVTLRGVHVSTTHKGRLLSWCEPELFAYLGDGFRVAIRYDATEPSLGCAIFCRELGARNRDNWALGQFLGIAEYAPECPQVATGLNFNETVEESVAGGHRKRYEAAVRTEFRAVAAWVSARKAAPAAMPAATSEARDGRGRVLRIERGAPAAAVVADAAPAAALPAPATGPATAAATRAPAFERPARRQSPAAAAPRIRNRWSELVEA